MNLGVNGVSYRGANGKRWAKGKYPVVQDCKRSDPTQQGWSWVPSAHGSSGTIKGPGALCLDNRTTGVYNGVPIPDQENNQFQLRACDGTDFQSFDYNTSGMPPPPPGAAAAKWGILQSNQVPKGPSSRKNQPGACSDGVAMTGPCCVRTNGWWDWNVGPSSCSSGDLNEAVSFANGHVEMRADSKATQRRCWSVWDFPCAYATHTHARARRTPPCKIPRARSILYILPIVYAV